MRLPSRSHDALLAERVREAFHRQPLLLAFTFDQDLGIADIELDTWPGFSWDHETHVRVAEEIAALVLELADAEAGELLRGRTFARTLQ